MSPGYSLLLWLEEGTLMNFTAITPCLEQNSKHTRFYSVLFGAITDSGRLNIGSCEVLSPSRVWACSMLISATSLSCTIPAVWLWYHTGTDVHLGSLWPFSGTAASASGEVKWPQSPGTQACLPHPHPRCTAGRAGAQLYTVSLGLTN